MSTSIMLQVRNYICKCDRKFQVIESGIFTIMIDSHKQLKKKNIFPIILRKIDSNFHISKAPKSGMF